MRYRSGHPRIFGPARTLAHGPVGTLILPIESINVLRSERIIHIACSKLILPIPKFTSDQKFTRWDQIRNPHPSSPEIAAWLGNISSQRYCIFKLGRKRVNSKQFPVREQPLQTLCVQRKLFDPARAVISILSSRTRLAPAKLGSLPSAFKSGGDGRFAFQLIDSGLVDTPCDRDLRANRRDINHIPRQQLNVMRLIALLYQIVNIELGEQLVPRPAEYAHSPVAEGPPDTKSALTRVLNEPTVYAPGWRALPRTKISMTGVDPAQHSARSL